MTPTAELLEGLAQWLASENLAQYDPSGGYIEYPDLPAVVFAPVDMPDTTLVLEAVEDTRTQTRGNAEPAPNHINVRFTYRTPGRDSRTVETLASAVLSRFTTLAYSGPGDDYNTFSAPNLVMGTLTISAGAIRLLKREPPVLAPKGKYSGDRWTRADSYRISVF
jgi:hypothetical protein